MGQQSQIWKLTIRRSKFSIFFLLDFYWFYGILKMVSLTSIWHSKCRYRFFPHNFLFWAKFAETALYVYKPTIWPYMEYCCHVWAGARSCYLKLLDKLQRKICGTVRTSFAALLNPWLIVEMWSAWVFSIGITLVDVHQNRLNLFQSFILVGGLLVILIDRMIFLLLFFDFTRMSMRTVFFLSANRILCL